MMKLTSKKIEFPDVIVAGKLIPLIEKSAASVPDKVISEMIKLSVPVFSIVNVFVVFELTVPKSVSSVVEGVTSLFTMLTEFPKTSISGFPTFIIIEVQGCVDGHPPIPLTK